MCDQNIWDAQISILKNKYSVSIFSLKSIATLDDAVQKIINKNKKKISVIGFSMGGFIAIKLAIEYPEILDKLVLIGTNARHISQKRKLLLKKSLITLNKNNFAKLFYQKNYSSYFADKDLENTSYQNTIYSMAKQLGYKAFLNQTNLILKRPNQLKKLNKIVSKTLIIRGKNDKLSSNIMNNELNKKIKCSVYKEIKNSSHFVMLEKPKTFNKIVTNFLF
jgi:pimeloyl-ACP methyl ester carboxylesterase